MKKAASVSPAGATSAEAKKYVIACLQQEEQGLGPWRVSPKRPCLKCGSDSWCLSDPQFEAVAVCRRDETGERLGSLGFVHVIKEDAFAEGGDAAEYLAKNPSKDGSARGRAKAVSANEREHRDKVYRALLDALPSAAAHAELAELRASEWGAMAVSSLFPRLLPPLHSGEAASVLAGLQVEFGRDGLRGVPGFIVQDSASSAEDPYLVRSEILSARFPRQAALAFPSFGADGLVEGLRVRRIGDGDGAKYWWFSDPKSEAKPTGRGGQPAVAVYRAPNDGREGNAGAYLITEGEKKAAVAVHALADLAGAVSVPGVDQWRGALDALDVLDPDKAAPVAVAYDMDARQKPQVRGALDALLQALADSGRSRVVVGSWDSRHKGLDDALCALGPDAIEWTPSEAAPRWWGKAIEAPETGFRLLPSGIGGGEGVRVVRVKRDREGQEIGFEVLATAAYRKVATKRPAEGGEPVAVFEVVAGGQSRTFEADPGAPNSRDWLRLLRRHAPGEPTLRNNSATLDALNFIAEAVAKTSGFEPRALEVHRPGFSEKLDAYRWPGVRVDAEGPHAEAPETCPRGFGPEGKATLDDNAADAAETASAFAEEWPALYQDPRDATIALAAGLCGPLAAPLSGSPCNMLLAMVGGTGSGKTTNARLLASLHGQDKAVASHGTVKGYLKLAEANRDSLVVVDDLREGRSIRDFVASAFDGSRRPTATRDQKLSRSPNLRGTAILTAETLDGAGESTKNRLVLIQFHRANREKLREINPAKARLRGLANPSALGAEAVRVAMAAGPEKMKTRLRMAAAMAEAHPMGSARGRDLAALAAVCVGLLGDVFAQLLGAPPAWLADPVACMDWLLATHAREEEQAKPARRFLDALQESIATRADFLSVPAEWTGPKSIQVRGGQAKPDRGQTLVFDVSGKHGERLFVAPRVAIRSLGLDLPEGAIRQSLMDEGLLDCQAPDDPRARLWVAGLGQQVRGWLIRPEGQGPGNGDSPALDRETWLQANSPTWKTGWTVSWPVNETLLETGFSFSLQSNSPTVQQTAAPRRPPKPPRPKGKGRTWGETPSSLSSPSQTGQSRTVGLSGAGNTVDNTVLSTVQPTGRGDFMLDCSPTLACNSDCPTAAERKKILAELKNEQDRFAALWVWERWNGPACTPPASALLERYKAECSAPMPDDQFLTLPERLAQADPARASLFSGGCLPAHALPLPSSMPKQASPANFPQM